ncbi:multiple coagulation factor deficiency protein 2 homolog [Ornithodoros turicata]|uniref:multiple coagulation factor deficiency protein 2 homolog n=1 Tax=Ornithodoros turicata TaxID=34597 RepID=UPI003138EAB4
MLVSHVAYCLLWVAVRFLDDVTCEQTPHPVSADLQALRDRYSAHAISRDLEHIKHDLSKVLHLAEVGDLNTEETTFYFMRMHDFDDNNQLDGLEMMQAFEHLMEHNNQTFDDHTVEGMVDNLLTVDGNQDGFVSYPEWINYIKTTTHEQGKKTEHTET